MDTVRVAAVVSSPPLPLPFSPDLTYSPMVTIHILNDIQSRRHQVTVGPYRVA